jgi:hypothetical protein
MQLILDTLSNTINFIIAFASPVFEIIIGDYSTSEFFFSKILLFILLFMILRNIIGRIPFGDDNPKFALIISIIISILGIRFINQNEFFESIFLQYGVIGIAITSILPLIIFFYFIEISKIGSYGRKVFWVLYMAIMGFIWSEKVRAGSIPPEANYIYILTLICAFIFLFFDKSINKYFAFSDINFVMNRTNKKMIRKLLKDLDDLKKDWVAGRFRSRHEYSQERKEIIKRIRELQKE